MEKSEEWINNLKRELQKLTNLNNRKQTEWKKEIKDSED